MQRSLSYEIYTYTFFCLLFLQMLSTLPPSYLFCCHLANVSFIFTITGINDIKICFKKKVLSKIISNLSFLQHGKENLHCIYHLENGILCQRHMFQYLPFLVEFIPETVHQTKQQFHKQVIHSHAGLSTDNHPSQHQHTTQKLLKILISSLLCILLISELPFTSS